MHRPPTAPVLRSVVCLSLAVLLSACAHINHLRHAQDSFSQGAAAENASRLAAARVDHATATEAAAARGHYAAALLSLKQLDRADIDALKDDQLLGTALSLEALCYWRLGKFDQALERARAALELDEQLFPRDRALLTALPGLIMADQAHGKLADVRSDASADTMAQIRRLVIGDDATPSAPSVESALDDAARQVGSRHPIRKYLLQSRLAAYATYMRAGQLARTDDAVQAVARAKATLIELRDFLRLLKDPEAANTVGFWKNRFSIATL